MYKAVLLSASLFSAALAAASTLEIPVKFLPVYESPSSPMKYGTSKVKVPAQETALVLIDFWDIHDPKPGHKAKEPLLRTQALLARLRQAGVHIIYTSESPVIRKYEQNARIKSEITSKNIQWSVQRQGLANEIHEWLSRTKNPILDDLRRLKREARAGGERPDMSISRFLTPQATDSIVETENEYRYVLWKEKIKLVLFAGASLNQCVLNSPQGVQNLASFAEIALVVVSDCVVPEATPNMSKEQNQKALLDYVAMTAAVVTDSKSIQVTK